MASFDRSARFRELVDLFQASASRHSWEIDSENAAAILRGHIEVSATRAGLTERTWFASYLTPQVVEALVLALLPAVASEGGTGRIDEPEVVLSRTTVARLVRDLGQAGRFAASHGLAAVPQADLHNLVADALIGIGNGIEDSADWSTISVSGYGLRLARRALSISVAGIDEGWRMAIGDADARDQITQGVRASMTAAIAALDEALPPLPRPRAVTEPSLTGLNGRHCAAAASSTRVQVRRLLVPGDTRVPPAVGRCGRVVVRSPLNGTAAVLFPHR